jgi:hypothetical protein
MNKIRIYTVGFELPGSEFEYIPFNSDQTLLDADIILFEPSFAEYEPTEWYQGTRLFGNTMSQNLVTSLLHWQGELKSAMDAGKLIIIYATKPLEYYVYTGNTKESGTGRSYRQINLIEKLNSYNGIPYIIKTEAKAGYEVKLTKDGGIIASYWKEYSNISPYEAFIEGNFAKLLLVTKSGDKIIGASVKDKGWMLFLPPIRYKKSKFIKTRSTKIYWTPEARKFGKKLVTSLRSLADSTIGGKILSPPPSWVSDKKYSMPKEAKFQEQISEIDTEISVLTNKRMALERNIEKEGAKRALLYEQGKPLERAVQDAMNLFGFTARNFTNGESEFDVVFESPEGRFLGEVEGKDNKPINIEKLSQLIRNLHEDYEREEVNEYAKGVLFGNAERLIPQDQRKDAFTLKCMTGAKRENIALVRTSDLFEPIKYLNKIADLEYAKSCREAIYSASGEIVVFPKLPES